MDNKEDQKMNLKGLEKVGREERRRKKKNIFAQTPSSQA
jgi:hypothetical protein